MGQYLKKLKTDPVGYTFSHCRWIAYNIYSFYTSIFMRAVLALKKIKIGHSPVFYGKAYFFRYPESVINIGNHCMFISAKLYNTVGVNRCCILSTLSTRAELYIGNASGFSGVSIGCAEKITIGNDCLVGANVLITDTDWHPLDPTIRSDRDAAETRPVKIGNNVFIGVNSIILKGTEIGDNSVIGAGSIVSSVIPPNVIAAGNPCKVIKSLLK
jgi:acetyltransferase-like isoleucine patch superfamily enzyme